MNEGRILSQLVIDFSSRERSVNLQQTNWGRDFGLSRASRWWHCDFRPGIKVYFQLGNYWGKTRVCQRLVLTVIGYYRFQCFCCKAAGWLNCQWDVSLCSFILKFTVYLRKSWFVEYPRCQTSSVSSKLTRHSCRRRSPSCLESLARSHDKRVYRIQNWLLLRKPRWELESEQSLDSSWAN